MSTRSRARPWFGNPHMAEMWRDSGRMYLDMAFFDPAMILGEGSIFWMDVPLVATKPAWNGTVTLTDRDANGSEA